MGWFMERGSATGQRPGPVCVRWSEKMPEPSAAMTNLCSLVIEKPHGPVVSQACHPSESLGRWSRCPGWARESGSVGRKWGLGTWVFCRSPWGLCCRVSGEERV